MRWRTCTHRITSLELNIQIETRIPDRIQRAKIEELVQHRANPREMQLRIKTT